jgi:hypothetical protein
MGALELRRVLPKELSRDSWEGRMSRTSQPYTAWGRTVVRHNMLQMEAGMSKARNRSAVAIAFSRRGDICSCVATDSFCPNTTPTMRKVAEDCTTIPATVTVQGVPFVHNCTLVTRSPKRAHHSKYPVMSTSMSSSDPATKVRSSAKLSDGSSSSAMTTPKPVDRAHRWNGSSSTLSRSGLREHPCGNPLDACHHAPSTWP